MGPSLEIFSQGEEIVTGQIVDTNAAWAVTTRGAYGLRRHSPYRSGRQTG